MSDSDGWDFVPTISIPYERWNEWQYQLAARAGMRKYERMNDENRSIYRPEWAKKAEWCAFALDRQTNRWHIWPYIPTTAMEGLGGMSIVVRYDGVPGDQTDRMCPDCMSAQGVCDKVKIRAAAARLMNSPR